ncbi:MAG TPA: DNA polymerase III subunit chi [Steroidobacteraceae bacterium]|nr:DNA polymerase III subunit chi [Steroidobacteraceae bacterium]
MPRVDFYVLEGSEPRPRLVYACRLAEKAFLLEQRVSILTDSAEDAQQLDDLLWTFRDRSFVPHERQPAAGEPGTPVVIAFRGETPSHRDLLINLGSEVPPGVSEYARVAEIVDADAKRRSAGRERYRYYLDQGLKPDTHNIGGTSGGDQETQ